MRRSELEPVGPANRKPSAPEPARDAGAQGSHLTADGSGSTPEVNVIGQRLEEAIEDVERALDQALLAAPCRLRVIHGHGTGRLRNGLRDHLRKHRSPSRR